MCIYIYISGSANLCILVTRLHLCSRNLHFFWPCWIARGYRLRGLWHLQNQSEFDAKLLDMAVLSVIYALDMAICIWTHLVIWWFSSSHSASLPRAIQSPTGGCWEPRRLGLEEALELAELLSSPLHGATFFETISVSKRIDCRLLWGS